MCNRWTREKLKDGLAHGNLAKYVTIYLQHHFFLIELIILMADRVSKEKRSEIMSKIRKTNTKPELLLKNKLKGTYFRYQPKLPGNPDFAIKSKKIVIFIDGCFWHKCPRCFRPPKSNRKYWRPKIEGNVRRDRRISKEYRLKGWKIIRIWEHQVKEDCDKIVKNILQILKSK